MRHVCIHGHFYQPERANPWTGRIDRQESAAPHHDWNERICSESYAPNATARILGPDGEVLKTRNNYATISFDFGPTLLAWLEKNGPGTYEAVLAADREGRRRFHGHGPAICQPYGHSILPLDSERDRRTQLLWGIRDFEHRFGRRPEGIWFPECAVDTPSLVAAAEAGLGFAVLAPHQAEAVRATNSSDWQPLEPGEVDTRNAYRCPLPDDRELALFFYDGPVSHDVSFGDGLADGAALAHRLAAIPGEAGQIVSIATDGETYGHHHRFGEMALATCLETLESLPGVELTVFPAFLETHPPADEVRVRENSSWSCVHGVERWRAACGCHTGLNPGWNQEWRRPLRAAVEWLRDALAPIYEEQAGRLLRDPWQARDRYIDVLLEPGEAAVSNFLADHAGGILDDKQRRRALGLLEMQRWALLVFTSCGWFFDDVSELTSVQVMRSACRAMELCLELAGTDLEPGFVDILYAAQSNIPEQRTGADVYRRLARQR